MDDKTNETAPKRPGGRAKGTTNLVTRTAKENILAVFQRVGGSAKMAGWAEENLTEFYKIYARLIPTEQQLSGPNGSPIQISWPLPRHPLEK